MLPNLLDMLTYRRPANSKTEYEFIRRFIDTVPGVQVDDYGNRWLLHPTSRTLIACHTDTVHRGQGRQRIVVNAHGIVALAPGEKTSNCLGADDTAGIYAALAMIEAQVPVSFIFHRSEEIGGRGSEWIAEKYAERMAEFDHCVSLDRRGTADIIDNQCVGQCCSTEFALALSDALAMGHLPARGTFTDSANYAHLIPECTNISVGYANEHTRQETLDTAYLKRLILRLCAIDWSALPVSRNPDKVYQWDDWFLSAEWKEQEKMLATDDDWLSWKPSKW